MLLKVFLKIETEGALQDSLYEFRVTLILKHKKTQQSMSLTEQHPLSR